MTLPGDAPAMNLPFEAGTCASVDVSAWREGIYDGDPLNTEFDKKEEAREADRGGPAPPPEACAKKITEDTGRPVMWPRIEGAAIQYGFSTKAVHYGEPVTVLMWVYNPGDREAGVMTCSDMEWFWALDVGLLDSAGHRLLTHSEEPDHKKAGTGI